MLGVSTGEFPDAAATKTLWQASSQFYTVNKDSKNADEMKVSGLMHDIGKIGVDEAILNKPDRWVANEGEVMKRHQEIGHRILSASSEFSDPARAVLEHHERWDGKGYPRGLKGEEIQRCSGTPYDPEIATVILAAIGDFAETTESIKE